MAVNRSNDAITAIEKTLGPDGAVVDDFLAFTDQYADECYTAGDKFAMPGLKEKPGIRLIEAVAQDLPPYEDRDSEVYDDYDLQLAAIIHADSSKYQANTALLKMVKEWFICGKEMKAISEQVTPASKDDTGEDFTSTRSHVVKMTFLVDGWMCREYIGDIIESEFERRIWRKHMNKVVKEGVCYAKGKVSKVLDDSLRRNIDDLARKTAVDYHPNSNDIVRDLVHPALFSFIKGVSKLKGGKNVEATVEEDDGKDFWGRPYEGSKFQWLPTPFKVTDAGKCLIQEYVNNLDRNTFPALYNDLQSLFELMLPYFEETWSYAKAMEFFVNEEDDNEVDKIPELDKKPVSFRGKELQIITKIVDYTLQPGQAYEGVWHAEGMSHENIVMTGIYFIDRDANISGGDLRFKRAFTVAERNKVFWNVPQTRPYTVNEFASDGLIPLGYFPTNQGYLLVFPNCHIHKLSKMVNESTTDAASRRIVVFFFINPEKKIVSTRDVPPQQNVIALKDAKNYRLELMAERKYDKAKLNIRDIELCEH
eukprot:gene12204-13460_t